jgi:hypothetical protein
MEREGEFEILDFEAEPECWREFSVMGAPVILKPDAYVRLGFKKHEDSYFVEVDRATESVATLRVKAEVFERYYQSGEEQHRRGVFPKVLWIAPDEGRASELRGAVSSVGQEADLHAVITAAAVPRWLAEPQPIAS